jgi:uncharacterized RDD family membrane protein YckC
MVTVIGFGRRLAATIIDGVIVGGFSFVVGLIIGVAATVLNWYTPNREIPIATLTVICALIFGLAYYLRAWTKSGQTIGKMTLGIKVVGEDGNPLSGGKAVLRYLGYILNAIVLSLGFLWIAFDRKRQGWHDKIARSYVVEGDATFGSADEVELVPSDPKQGWIWLVVWIVIAVASPGGLMIGLWFLGPFVSRAVRSLIWGIP